MRNRLLTLGWGITAAFLAGCGARADSDGMDVPEDLFGDLGEHLTALTNTCQYNSTTKLMTIALAANEVALITRELGPSTPTDDFLLVNGVDCNIPVPAAGASAVAKIAVTTTGSGNETVIFDFTNGTYAMGASATTTTGITVDLGAGTADVLGFKFGGTGNDTVVYGASGATFNGDAFKDLTVANAEIHKVYLGDGDDSYSGAGSTPTGAAFVPTTRIEVMGGAGNDTFLQGAVKTPKEVLSGGTGTDSLSYGSRTLGISVTLSATADANDGDGSTTPSAAEADDVRDDIENITGGPLNDTITGASTTGNMTITGGAGNDTLTGGGGNDTINGGDGVDTINGGAGNDTLNGNDGNDTFLDPLAVATSGDDTFNGGLGVDTLSYAGRTAAVTMALDGATAGGEATEGDIAAIDVENLTGGTAGDTLTGNASNNILIGGLGDDTLSGLGGKDTASYATHTAAVVATLGATGGAGAESDTLNANIENLTGGSGGDTLTGDVNSNELVGGAGNDTLDGLAGDDVLEGGAPGNTEANTLTCGAGEGDIGYGEGTLGTKSATCEF